MPPIKGGPIIQPINPRPPSRIVGGPTLGHRFPPPGGITVLPSGQRIGIGVRLR